MRYSTSQSLWEIVRRQHGVIARWQLLAAGLTDRAIRRRVEKGRLFIVHRGVYAVGRRELSQHGDWMAAVLAYGEGAALSHRSAAELWGIRPKPTRPIHVSTPFAAHSRDGLVAHRRKKLTATGKDGIPVTRLIDTLFDVAIDADERRIEADINEAATLRLVTPRQLHGAAKKAGRRPGAAAIRKLLDRQTFVLTDSELERLFLPITRRAGLPPPQTRTYVNGFKVDFWWPELGLVIETDGGHYHATPSQQARDRLRDQTHMATGLTPLRFTHGQVKFERERVEQVFVAVVKRLT